jgi:hypothetical protein
LEKEKEKKRSQRRKKDVPHGNRTTNLSSGTMSERLLSHVWSLLRFEATVDGLAPYINPLCHRIGAMSQNRSHGADFVTFETGRPFDRVQPP